MTNGLKGPWTQEEEYFKEQLNNMSKLPENQECADCTSKAPRWSVYNHGIFVCIKCSGQHRNLGTGISKVRSINMDRWRQDQFDCMVGNAKANAELMYNFPQGGQKPNEDDDYGRQKFIQQKYAQRKWARREDQEPVESTTSSTKQQTKQHVEVRAMVVPQPQVVRETTPPLPQKVQKTVQQAPIQQIQPTQQPKVAPQPDLLDLFNDQPVIQPVTKVTVTQPVAQPTQKQVQAVQQPVQQPKPAQNDIFGDIMQMYDKPASVAPSNQPSTNSSQPQKSGFDISSFIGGGQQQPKQDSSYKPQGFQW